MIDKMQLTCLGIEKICFFSSIDSIVVHLDVDNECCLRAHISEIGYKSSIYCGL